MASKQELIDYVADRTELSKVNAAVKKAYDVLSGWSAHHKAEAPRILKSSHPFAAISSLHPIESIQQEIRQLFGRRVAAIYLDQIVLIPRFQKIGRDPEGKRQALFIRQDDLRLLSPAVGTVFIFESTPGDEFQIGRASCRERVSSPV